MLSHGISRPAVRHAGFRHSKNRGFDFSPGNAWFVPQMLESSHVPREILKCGSVGRPRLHFNRRSTQCRHHALLEEPIGPEVRAAYSTLDIRIERFKVAVEWGKAKQPLPYSTNDTSLLIAPSIDMNVEVFLSFKEAAHQRHSEGDSLRDIDAITSELEQQRAAIERAISALREITGLANVSRPVSSKAPGPTARKKWRLSPAGLRRIVAANKKRWAASKKAQQNTPASNRAVATKQSPSKRAGSKKSAVKSASTTAG